VLPTDRVGMNPFVAHLGEGLTRSSHRKLRSWVWVVQLLAVLMVIVGLTAAVLFPEVHGPEAGAEQNRSALVSMP
jgi:hypothetical protein